MSADDFERLLPELKMRLKALASQSGRSAPPRLEAALVAEFRSRQRRKRTRRSANWYWAAAAAACLVVAAGLMRFERRPTPPPRAAALLQAPTAVEARLTQAPPAAPARKTARRPRRVARPAAPRPGSKRPEMATEFIPVSYAATPAGQASIVRVRLPRTALLSFGLPMNVERAAEPVLADVLLGEDGVARAIRFVR